MAGFREFDALTYGRFLKVDDVTTMPDERGAGHGERLMGWLVEEARRLGCESLQLDSGVGADRAPHTGCTCGTNCASPHTTSNATSDAGLSGPS